MAVTRGRRVSSPNNHQNQSAETPAEESVIITKNIPQEVFSIARGKLERGGQKGYHSYAKTAASVLGMTQREFDSTFKEMVEKAEKMEAAEVKRNQLEILRRTLNSYKLPSNLKALKDKANEIATDMSTEDNPVFIDVLVSDDGLDMAVRRGRRGPRGDGEVGEKSRISSWQAYERGQTLGDSFKVTKLGIREYRDETTGETFNNLTRWLSDNHPDSHAANELRRYGQLPAK